MAQVHVLRQVAGRGYPTPVVEASEEIVARKVQRATSGAAALYDDANVTAITIGGGAAQTSVTVGGGAAYTGATIGKSGVTDTLLGSLQVNQDITVTGNLTVNGTTTTVNTDNLSVEDDVIVLRNLATPAAAGPAGIVIERGTTSANDATILWSEASSRFELGLFASAGGTNAAPANVSSFSDLKLDDLLLAGTAITADAGLTITSTAATLALVATSTNKISFSTNGTERANFSSAGNLLFNTDNTNDIGATGATRPRKIYVGTDLNVGSSLIIGTSSILSTAASYSLQGQQLSIATTTADAISFGINSSTVWQINASGHLMAFTDNTYDIGASAATRPRHVYAATDVVVAGAATLAASALTTTGAFDVDVAGVATFGSTSASNIQLQTNNTVRWIVGATSGHLQANVDNTYDIGATASARPQHVYVGTDVVVAGTVTLSGTTLSSSGALGVTATGANNLTLTARGAGTPLNDATDTALVGFTSASIIGALNELKAATASGAASVQNTYTAAATLSLGEAVYISTADTVNKATASSDNAASNYIGVAAAAITAAASGYIKTGGVAVVRLVTGLTVANGERLFLSTTAGLLTNVAPSSSGNVVQEVGFIKDVTTYDGSGNLTVEAQLRDGPRLVV